MIKNILVVLALFLVCSCTDETETRKVLIAHGFTNIVITGYEFFSCGKDDFSHTGFSATGPTGVQINGVVCCGLVFKGCTVRF